MSKWFSVFLLFPLCFFGGGNLCSFSCIVSSAVIARNCMTSNGCPPSLCNMTLVSASSPTRMRLIFWTLWGAPARCSVTVTGHQCDEWGENDFGLDPTSNACEQVDGLDKPWCYFGEDDDQWDFCDCAAVAVAAAAGGGGGGGSDSASTSTVKATASDWEKTDRTDADGNPLQRIDMKTLMLQGKITRWWWDMNNPSSTRLTDQNFDNEVGSRDYFVR